MMANDKVKQRLDKIRERLSVMEQFNIACDDGPVKRQEQQELLKNFDLTYLGNGPAATGATNGWRAGAELYTRCILCGYFMSLAANRTQDCFCSTMYTDGDWGRFGSGLGDEQIEVYRAQPKSKE